MAKPSARVVRLESDLWLMDPDDFLALAAQLDTLAAEAAPTRFMRCQGHPSASSCPPIPDNCPDSAWPGSAAALSPPHSALQDWPKRPSTPCPRPAYARPKYTEARPAYARPGTPSRIGGPGRLAEEVVLVSRAPGRIRHAVVSLADERG